MIFIKKYSLYSIFALSLLATLGSLYFSDVLGWAPCILCWYQRILVYPLVVISAVAIIYKDAKAYRYILPLSILATLVALFHNLLYWGVIPENFVPCRDGISCTDVDLQLFGIITIPFLSLIASLIIVGLTLIYRKYENK
jgi:disulfide bond formation protein DsbB